MTEKMTNHLLEKRIKVTKNKKILRRQSHIGHTRIVDSTKTKRARRKKVNWGYKKNKIIKNIT